MRRAWVLALAAVVPVLATCTRNLPEFSQVVDLRVLAVQAEPPEVAPDGRVRLTALVADPGGGGRPLEHRWRACDPRFPIVDPAVDCPVELALSLATRTDGSADLSLPELVAHLAGSGEDTGAGQSAEGGQSLEDDLVGLEGVPVTVVYTVLAGPEQREVAIKRVVVSTSATPNRNPRIVGLQIAGKPWPEGEPLELPITGPLDAGGGGRGDDDDEEDGGVLRFKVAYDPASFEVHAEVRASRGAGTPVAEELVASWYITHGDLEGRRQREELAVDMLPPLDRPYIADEGGARFRIDAVPRPSESTFWVVVLDGRGGVAWAERRVRWRD